MSRIIRAAALYAAFVTAAGCGPDQPDTGVVDGEVTLDGKPIPSGEIAFFSVDDSRHPAGGPIVDGKFQVEIATGTFLVRINSLEIIRPAQLPDDEGLARERIPTWYNAATELRQEVVSGTNTVRYELKTKR